MTYLSAVPSKEGIEDHTETHLINLRQVIYLTIMNALDYDNEEAVHKLLRVQLSEGEEVWVCYLLVFSIAYKAFLIELVNMVTECCSQERSYSTLYGLVGDRSCKLNRVWNESLRKLRDIVTQFIVTKQIVCVTLRISLGHLANDAIYWIVFQVIKTNKDDMTSSSRIFVKIRCRKSWRAWV